MNNALIKKFVIIGKIKLYLGKIIAFDDGT